jgi:hypothetical protein
LRKTSPIGSIIVEKQPIFIVDARTFWASKIEHQDIDYVLNNLTTNYGTLISKNEISTLKQLYANFLDEYKKIVEANIVPYDEIPKNKERIKI